MAEDPDRETLGRLLTGWQAAFQAAGLPYYNPHSLRSTLVQLTLMSRGRVTPDHERH